jgi:hypothetical protein
MEKRNRDDSGGWLTLVLMAVGVIALYLLFPPTPF